LTVCISPKKKKARGKAAAKEHGKNVVKQCLKNRMNWAKWGTKGIEKTHRLTTVSEVIDDDHLQELKDDVRPLLKGESVMRLLQQDAKEQEASAEKTSEAMSGPDFTMTPQQPIQTHPRCPSPLPQHTNGH
jgi:hypothetical protein